MFTVEGNILNFKEQYMAQQCNTISTKSHGLSQQISRKWPHCDPYKKRRNIGTKNLAIENDRPNPGSIEVFPLNEKKEQFVVCMYAQRGMGVPYSFNNQNKELGLDDYKLRAFWFEECLKEIEKLKPKSIAFPYKIGCGLAGGNWEETYKPLLEKFAARNPNVKIVLYKL